MGSGPRRRPGAPSWHGYESPKFRWPGSPARIPDYDDIAQSVPAFLSAWTRPHSPLVFVTHSQGGLILQRHLVWMLSEGRGRELARVRAIALLACPNERSEYLASIRAVTGQPAPAGRPVGGCSRGDVPVAAAETYFQALWGGDEPGGRTVVPPAVVHFIEQGADWARHNPEPSGRQIQNMLDHYTALHTQEPPSSYQCAAILVGMATTLLADSGPRGVASYLKHLAVMDHAEALAYSRRHASLEL